MSEAEEVKKAEAEAEADTDLLQALTKPIGEMSDEEVDEAVLRIRKLRKVKLSTTKQKSSLDKALEMVGTDTAQKLLAKLDILDAAEKAKKKIEEEGEKKDESTT